jgi:predicted transcriptional regulator
MVAQNNQATPNAAAFCAAAGWASPVVLQRRQGQGGEMSGDAQQGPATSVTVHLADLSGPEADVMRIVSAKRAPTAREVYDELSDRLDLGYTSVMSALRSLTGMGLVDKTWHAAANHYAPAARNVALARRVVDRLIDELLAGDAGPILEHLEHRLADAEQASGF